MQLTCVFLLLGRRQGLIPLVETDSPLETLRLRLRLGVALPFSAEKSG